MKREDIEIGGEYAVSMTEKWKTEPKTIHKVRVVGGPFYEVPLDDSLPLVLPDGRIVGRPGWAPKPSASRTTARPGYAVEVEVDPPGSTPKLSIYSLRHLRAPWDDWEQGTGVAADAAIERRRAARAAAQDARVRAFRAAVTAVGGDASRAYVDVTSVRLPLDFAEHLLAHATATGWRVGEPAAQVRLGECTVTVADGDPQDDDPLSAEVAPPVVARVTFPNVGLDVRVYRHGHGLSAYGVVDVDADPDLADARVYVNDTPVYPGAAS